MSDPREEKLPVWAKNVLASERARADRAERMLAEHLETVEPSRISYGSYENPLYIPDEFGLATVRFELGPKVGDQHVHDQISVGLREDFHGVRHLDINGGHAICVYPSASNLVRVYHAE